MKISSLKSMVGRQKNRALHCKCSASSSSADAIETTGLEQITNLLCPHTTSGERIYSIPTWGWCQWEPDVKTLKNTVNTKFVPNYYYCYYWHQLSIFYNWVNEVNNERHMWVKEGTSKTEGTSHSTRTYVLHLGVEHCTRWQLKRLNHDLSNTLWIRIQCTSQVRKQTFEWLCVNGNNNCTRSSQVTEGPIAHLQNKRWELGQWFPNSNVLLTSKSVELLFKSLSMMDGWKDGCMDGWTEGQMIDRQTDRF